MTSRTVGGRYQIVRPIAEGGMGAVYEAVHTLSKKTVALKVLFPHIGKDEASRQRFLREVSAPAQIGHEGIVEVYDAGIDDDDGSLFVAMELLQGETLRDWLGRPQSLDVILDMFARVLEPLAAAHAQNIVHRDLKPENIFLAQLRNGQQMVKILDFGIARDLDHSAQNVTHTGIAMGTPHYMAPEQAMSARGVKTQADIWAIGAMLYEAITGRTPFEGETASAIVVHACTKPHPPLLTVAPHCPPALAHLVDRCLAKEPTQRPADAATLGRELAAVRSGHAPMGGQPPAGGQPMGGQPMGGHAGMTPPGAMSVPGHGGPASAHGMGTPTPPTQPAWTPQAWQSGHGPGTGPHSTQGTSKSSSGLGLLLVLGALAIMIIAGGITAAVLLFSDGGGASGGQVAGGTGTVRLNTPPGGGQLVIDGRVHGLVAPGDSLQLPTGSHELELRVGGTPVGLTTVEVQPGTTVDAMLEKGAGVTGESPAVGEQVLRGRLEAGDETLQSGEFADRYTFPWTTGRSVRLEVRSGSFNTYVIVKSPSDKQYDNDDAAAGVTNAGLTISVNESGTWTVLVTSQRSGEQGDYDLVVR